MKSRSIITILLLIAASTAFAQATHRTRRNKVKDTLIVKSYTDSLRNYKQMLDSTSINIPDSDRDPRTFYIFAPATFYYSVAKDLLRTSDNTQAKQPYDSSRDMDRIMMNIYLNHPNLVAKSERSLNRIGAVHKEMDAPIKNKVQLVTKADALPIEEDDEEHFNLPMEIVVKKPNFWKYSGDYYLQMLQNYVSSNWYKGGESNYSMVASVTMQANYNNKQKVKLDNKLEMKLGFQTSRGDTLHSFKTSEDLIRYTGKLGLQASKKWYYSLQLIAYTQFMRGYKSNDKKVYSDILSPLNINLSVGMDYNVEWFNKKLTGNIHLAPLAYNFKYVGRKELATRYGLDEGKHTLNDFGSECTVDLTWAFTNTIKWKTRLYGYTTYERAEVEWENTISFQFNKYITSNLFIYPRFDDGAKKDESHGYWQLKEYMSIGFAYSF
ncbi:DUF3078 domain-containing protein [uncultured Prevotella sp.]|uniref:DUF3078 domain-containing protein n=1 Tax=uncultured Prevotella sp. TaxID=159272 RepID=UPI00280451E6|nr:DUF3078 domain-containing protein [uncultured Prevotella sp.]